MNHLNLNLCLRMSERTEIPILALVDFFRVFCAKFTFVSAWVIKLLYFVVRKQALLVIAFLLIAEDVAVFYL